MYQRFLFSFPVFLLFFAGIMTAQTPASSIFQINNVRAVVNADGTMFNDLQQGQFVPVQSGVAEKTLLHGFRHLGGRPGPGRQSPWRHTDDRPE